jgi:hypothetical protein
MTRVKNAEIIEPAARMRLYQRLAGSMHQLTYMLFFMSMSMPLPASSQFT